MHTKINDKKYILLFLKKKTTILGEKMGPLKDKETIKSRGPHNNILNRMEGGEEGRRREGRRENCIAK